MTQFQQHTFLYSGEGCGGPCGIAQIGESNAENESKYKQHAPPLPLSNHPKSYY